MFNEVLNNSLWEMLSNETNRYAQQTLSNKRYKKKKSDYKWMPIDKNELKIYFALCLIMSQVRKK